MYTGKAPYRTFYSVLSTRRAPREGILSCLICWKGTLEGTLLDFVHRKCALEGIFYHVSSNIWAYENALFPPFQIKFLHSGFLILKIILHNLKYRSLKTRCADMMRVKESGCENFLFSKYLIEELVCGISDIHATVHLHATFLHRKSVACAVIRFNRL